MPKKKLAFNSNSARKSLDAIERLERHQASVDGEGTAAADPADSRASSPLSSPPGQPATYPERLRRSVGERVRVLAHREDGRDFARQLLAPDRHDVAVLIAAFDGLEFIDLDVLLDEVSSDVLIALAASTAVSAGLIDELKAATGNGYLGVAAEIVRVYGYGGTWWDRQVPRIEVRKAPIDHARYVAHAVRRCEDNSTATTYSRSETRQVVEPRLVTGTAGLYEDDPYQAYVSVEGQLYTLNFATLGVDPGLVVTDVLAQGTEVRVRVNDADGLVTAIPDLVSSAQLQRQVRADTVVLGRIHATGPAGDVEVAPGMIVPISGVTDSFRVGQIIPVALLDDGEGVRAELADEDELSHVVSYIPDGPSWLYAEYQTQERKNAEEYAREIVDADTDRVEPHDVISVIEDELERLRRAIDQAFDDNVAEYSTIERIEQQDKREQAYRLAIEDLKRQLHSQRTQTQQAKDEAARSRARVEILEKQLEHAEQDRATDKSRIERLSHRYTPEQLRALTAPKPQAASPTRSRDGGEWEARIGGQEFSSPEEQLRFEIELMWSIWFSLEDKEKWPIRPYTFSKGFFDTLHTVGRQVPRRKLLRVLAEIVTCKSREGAHARILDKRSSGQGGAKTRPRNDGAIARRVRLEQSTHAARRVLYWDLPDGTVELSAIAVHDDYQGYN
ncbi:hypothetical protein H8R18_06230 [Nanchangia anserum]|uniref:Uncharacterized protein n=1 Tax=Nanchangia anserum TaxID=2692125 RepID=A0A8I0GBB3_9ACTO|nr:hypothetical protein [Nanchangia anserum]MBD3689131.1 hypothetical protein [Nanchangia anserum]QOX81365.1 hypothetical protein H8R18_06230 [Nanchangia anserum]